MIAARIIIVGAGPAGAMLAYLLASRGVNATLIERQRDFEREFRGEVLMPSGVESLRQAGLASQFQSLPHRALSRAVILRRNRRLFTLDLAAALGDDITFTAVSQPALLEMLVAEASRFPTFQFHRGASVRDLIESNGRITGVELASHDQSNRIEADLVIGADGRASTIRRHSGLDATHRPQPFDIVWCKAPLPPPELAFDEARVYVGDRHFALMYPTYDDRLQIAWVIRKGAIGELRRQGVEHWVREMSEHISPELGAHLRANIQDITQPFLLDVICDLMPRWTKPGLLLIGDSAHPMSPVGGQGINIALRDAIVTANHLVPALRSSPEVGALHAMIDAAALAIQYERMPEVQSIQRMQQFPPRLLFASPAIARPLLALAPLLAFTGIARTATTSLLRRFAFGLTDVRLKV